MIIRKIFRSINFLNGARIRERYIFANLKNYTDSLSIYTNEYHNPNLYGFRTNIDEKLYYFFSSIISEGMDTKGSY